MNRENSAAHKEQKLSQEITLIDRARLTISGVEDVLSFDDASIILKSSFGSIAVDGKDLHITRLSVETGELFIEGRIDGVLFFEPSEQKKKRGFFMR